MTKNNWFIPTQEHQENILNIVDFLSSNGDFTFISTIVFLIVYFYARNKIRVIYLLDFIMVSFALLSLYLVALFPHKLIGLAYFIEMSFR